MQRKNSQTLCNSSPSARSLQGKVRLPGGPVGPDLPSSQPLASHLLDGVLRILFMQRNTQTSSRLVTDSERLAAWSNLAKQLQDEGLCHVPGQIPHIPRMGKRQRCNG
ncbi:hypothetical protein EYF80_047691 [Liparis tanakae]|uniref:Uncharacterized protein n=1 Tax=Liparis tanakae TaxID=230148 RepID=A0A4Z2FLY3_9TELE|nr:hypothetical protein EYF80_047691 [Liparis tanakae]